MRRFTATPEDLRAFLEALRRQGFVTVDAQGWYQLADDVQLTAGSVHTVYT